MIQSEAKKFCEEEQEGPARLVEIDSAEENKAIIAEIKRRNFVSRKIKFWLGITDRHTEGHWVLESTGKSVVFTDWHSGEPNNWGSGPGALRKPAILHGRGLGLPDDFLTKILTFVDNNDFWWTITFF